MSSLWNTCVVVAAVAVSVAPSTVSANIVAETEAAIAGCATHSWLECSQGSQGFSVGGIQYVCAPRRQCAQGWKLNCNDDTHHPLTCMPMEVGSKNKLLISPGNVYTGDEPEVHVVQEQHVVPAEVAIHKKPDVPRVEPEVEKPMVVPVEKQAPHVVEVVVHKPAVIPHRQVQKLYSVRLPGDPTRQDVDDLEKLLAREWLHISLDDRLKFVNLIHQKRTQQHSCRSTCAVCMTRGVIMKSVWVERRKTLAHEAKAATMGAVKAYAGGVFGAVTKGAEGGMDAAAETSWFWAPLNIATGVVTGAAKGGANGLLRGASGGHAGSFDTCSDVSFKVTYTDRVTLVGELSEETDGAVIANSCAALTDKVYSPQSLTKCLEAASLCGHGAGSSQAYIVPMADSHSPQACATLAQAFNAQDYLTENFGDEASPMSVH